MEWWIVAIFFFILVCVFRLFHVWHMLFLWAEKESYHHRKPTTRRCPECCVTHVPQCWQPPIKPVSLRAPASLAPQLGIHSTGVENWYPRWPPLPPNAPSAMLQKAEGQSQRCWWWGRWVHSARIRNHNRTCPPCRRDCRASLLFMNACLLIQ